MSQSFPAALRIVQSVATLAGADDSLASINTTLLSPNAIVLVQENNKLYVLRKTSTAAAASPNIIDPTAGPGRWFLYGEGASYNQAVSVAHAAIGPQTSVQASASVIGVEDDEDIIVFNIPDSGVPAGVVISGPRVTGAGTASFRFTNVTGATVAGSTVSLRCAVLKG